MEISISKKTLKTIGIVGVVILGVFILQMLLTGNKTPIDTNASSNIGTVQLDNVEKIQVVHFHAAQQCWSCITIGEYSEKIIKTSFPVEYKNGKVEYLDINIDEQSNSAIVKKFGVSGSSLYFNVISASKDNISEDIQVWNLVSNEQKFTTYFVNKLQSYLK